MGREEHSGFLRFRERRANRGINSSVAFSFLPLFYSLFPSLPLSLSVVRMDRFCRGRDSHRRPIISGRATANRKIILAEPPQSFSTALIGMANEIPGEFLSIPSFKILRSVKNISF